MVPELNKHEECPIPVKITINANSFLQYNISSIPAGEYLVKFSQGLGGWYVEGTYRKVETNVQNSG